jgi:hypothetical protein
MRYVRLSHAWSGDPITEHRTMEIDTRRFHARAWLRPLRQPCKPYHFADYGPHCFGVAWFGFMIFLFKD